MQFHNAISWCNYIMRSKPTCNFGCVSADEVIHCLLQRELADRWQHPECITAQQYDVTWVATNAGDVCVLDVVDGVAGSSVLSHWPVNKKFSIIFWEISLHKFLYNIKKMHKYYVFWRYTDINICKYTHPSSKSTSRVSGSNITFSSTVPNRIAS